MPVPSPRPFLDRLTRWARGHTLAVDACWAILWFGLSMAPWIVYWPDFAGTDAFYLGLTVACCTALAMRRTWPLPALAALAMLLAIHILWLDHLTVLAMISGLVGAYTAQAELPRPWRATGFVLLLAGAAWGILSIPPDALSEDLGLRLNSVLSSWTAIALFSLLGTFRRRNRQEFDRVVEHARLVETGRDREVRLAALAERTHIAREVHDVLAHSLNVIVSQADGGRYAAVTNPEHAVTALATIAQVGRESSAELRQLLGVLREDEDRTSAPVPGVGDLPDLLDGYRRAGLRIRLIQHGSPPTLPTTASLTVYRVVQESLANALKHAGGGAGVRVELTWSPEHVEITVANRLPEAVVPASADDSRRGPGHGLVGMRERVGLHGGTLDVGADEATGNWRVAATVPWEGV